MPHLDSLFSVTEQRLNNVLRDGDRGSRVQTVKIPVHLPGSLVYQWEAVQETHLSQQTVLISGVDAGDVNCSISPSGKETEIRMNASSFVMMMPNHFWNAVTHNATSPHTTVYDESHPKVVAHMQVIKELKKSSMANPVVYVHKEPLPRKVLPAFVPICEKYPKGSRIGLTGNKDFPEIVASLEMKTEPDGFYTPLIKAKVKDVVMPNKPGA